MGELRREVKKESQMLGKRMETVETSLKDLNKKNGVLDKSVKGVGKEVASVRGEVAGLRSDLEREIGCLRGDLEREIGGLKGSFDGLKGSFDKQLDVLQMIAKNTQK